MSCGGCSPMAEDATSGLVARLAAIPVKRSSSAVGAYAPETSMAFRFGGSVTGCTFGFRVTEAARSDAMRF